MFEAPGVGEVARPAPGGQQHHIKAQIESGASALGKPSRAVANQIRTVARHRIVKRIGRLTSRELDAVDRTLEIQLGLRREP